MEQRAKAQRQEHRLMPHRKASANVNGNHLETIKLNREELITLVQKIMDAAGTEEETHVDLEILIKNVSDPKVTDYIYWSEEEMTAEQIVDKALQYNPILL